MKALEITNQDLLTIDASTGLREESVEIWERETIRTIIVDGAKHPDHTRDSILTRGPKLVIDDAFAQTRVFITKARSESGELEELLREVKGSKAAK